MLKPKHIIVLLALIASIQSIAQVTFQAQAVSGCAPFGVVINVTQPTSGINSYNWVITTPSGSTLTATSAQYVSIFNTPGTYDVSLTINGSQNQTINDYITVYAKPTASFSVDDNTGCFPHCVNFTDTSTPGTGSIVSWTWDFGNGSTGSGSNPQHCYAAAGNFSPVLSIADANGCFANVTMPSLIQVTSNFPTALFESSVEITCNAPTQITFDNGSTGNLSFESNWTFGDGQSTNTATPETVAHTYNAPGTYEVCLEVNDTENCAGTVCHDIVILDDPQPSFTQSETVACVGQAITFQQTSSPAPTQIEWDFDGNGTVDSFSNNPTFTYTSEGTYTPVMTVIYSPTCSATVGGNPITINPGMTVSITADQTSSCTPPFTPTISANVSGTGPFSYNWIIAGNNAGNTASINPTFDNNGTYTVSVQVENSNGCVAAASNPNFIQVSTPTLFFSAPELLCFGEPCEPNNIALSNTDQIISYSWDFDEDGIEDSNEQHPSYFYTAAGEYNITLTVETSGGCVTSYTPSTPVTVQAPLNTTFTSSVQTSCAGEAIEFCIPTANGNTYSWNFFDDSGWITMNPDETCIEHMYEDTGYFDVGIMVINGICNLGDTLFNYIYIDPPVALFEYSVNCDDNLTVTVSDLSIEADTWEWDFGDGSPVVTGLQEATHSYSTEGNYSITLTVTNNNQGCPDDKIHTLDLVPPSSNLLFDNTVGCAPLNVSIDGERINHYWHIQVSNGDDLVIDWNDNIQMWDVTYQHGGQTDFTQVVSEVAVWPLMVFTEEGCYDFDVYSENEFGCSSTAFYQDAVCVTGGTNFASFSYNIIESCDSVTIELIPDANNLTSSQWQFSDGQGTTIESPTHTFLPPYNYNTGITATLIADNTFGCSSSVTQTINVDLPSIPSFTISGAPGCIGDEIIFTSTTQGPVVSSTWNFGDLGSGILNESNELNASHVFNQNGNYEVCFTVESNSGCIRTSCVPNAVVINNPEVNFTYTSAINNCLFGVNFENTTPGNISSLEWNFGDAQFGSNGTTFHTYPIGVYDVTLTVTNTLGCTDSLVVADILNYGDVIGPYSVTLDNANCAPFEITLEAFNVSDSYFSYFWDFNDGNGNPTGNTTVDHSYTSPGVYCPQLIMTDPNGCQVFIPCENPIEVSAFEMFYSQPEEICFGESITFNVSNADTYSWSGPTTVESTGVGGEYVFTPNENGFYLLTGTYADCERTDTIFVTVHELPVLTLDVPSSVCHFDDDFALESGLPVGGYYTLGGFPSDVFSPSMAPEASYEVGYHLTDEHGCYNEVFSEVFIHALPTVELPVFPAVCNSESIFPLNTASPSGGEYFVNGVSAVSFDPSVGYGMYNVEYIYQDEFGCVNNATRNIQVNAVPEIVLDFSSICLNEGLFIQNNSTVLGGSVASSEWLFEDGGSFNGIHANNIQFASTGTKDIHVDVYSNSGCVSSMDTTVVVRTLPVASFNMEDGCQSTDLTFTSTSTFSQGNIISWEWTMEGNNVGNLPEMEYSFEGWGTLPASLIVTADNGCTDTISQSVSVYPTPQITLLVDPVCLNDVSSFQSFIELEVGSVTGVEWNFGDASNVSTLENPVHQYSADGTFTATMSASSSLGCVGTAEIGAQVYPLPEVDFILVEDTYCSGDELEMIDMSSVAAPSQNAQWNWYLDENFISASQNATSEFNAPGLYDVRLEVTTNHGCSSDSTMPSALQIYPTPEAGFVLKKDEVLMYSPVVHVESDASADVMQWEYDFGDGTAVETFAEGNHTYEAWDDYTITQTVYNVFGCSASIQKNVSVLASLQVNIPNAFTPDGNGHNDFFKPVLYGADVLQYSFIIFDRWGKVVYETEDPEGCWNGQMNNDGVKVQDGVYNWRLKIRSSDDPILRVQQGNVTLIR